MSSFLVADRLKLRAGLVCSPCMDSHLEVLFTVTRDGQACVRLVSGNAPITFSADLS